MVILTLAEMAERLKSHPKTVARIAKAKGVGRKLGSEWRFAEADADALMQPVQNEKKEPKLCRSKSTRRANRGAITACGEQSEASPSIRAQELLTRALRGSSASTSKPNSCVVPFTANRSRGHRKSAAPKT